MPSRPSTKSGRIPCCVPFCGRSLSFEKFGRFSEVMCGKHFAMAPKRARKLHRDRLRRLARLQGLHESDPSRVDPCSISNALEDCARSWDRVKSYVLTCMEASQ